MILICAVTICIAQVNLIPNPGFEENHSVMQCPEDSTKDIIGLNNWISPSATPYAYCVVESCFYSDDVPMNDYGFQLPYEGSAYVCIQIVWDTAFSPWRAYIQVKLNQVLDANHKYCFSVYISQSDSSGRATDDFGAFFSDTAVSGADCDVLPFIPQVQNTQGRFLDSKTNWMLVDGFFIADGGEEYVTIGNFLDDYNTDWIFTPPYGQQTYGWFYIGGYYIDMISLFDCTDFYYTGDAGESPTICRGESVSIGTDENASRRYSWSPSAGLNDSTVARPLASPVRTTTYVLTVIDEYIQQTTDTVTVFVDTTCGANPVYIANVFSPNGDGKNDMLLVHSQSVREISFKVYNRWGNLLFESKSLDNGWDGKLRGEDCPEGVYFFVAEVTFDSGESVVKKGNVTIVR